MKDTLKDLLAFLSRPIITKIHKFKDAHHGETGYIIGDGVSIKWFDLSAFSDKISIAVAHLPFHNDFLKLQTKYFILNEPWWFYPYFKLPMPPCNWWRNKIQAAYKEIIKSNKDKEFFTSLSNLPVLCGSNITYLFRDLYDSRLPENYISNRVMPYAGSLSISITLASYLGFSHVYLVGFDYTHAPSRWLHWYEKGKGIIKPPEPDYQKDFFDIAQEFIDITTVTIDGKGSYLNSITYEELTGRKPEFKENTELLSKRNMSILSTWPGYTIF